jgi:transglutaminase-like putative cysteine protease
MNRRVLVAGMILGVSAMTRVTLAEEQPAQPSAGSPQWFRGQLHTHSYWSDGQAFPEQAIEAYKQRGYNFMCLSDHNQFAKSTNTWREVKPTKITQASFDSYVKTCGRDWVESRTESTTNGTITSVRLKTYSQVKAKVDEPGKFLLLPGVELTQSRDGVDVHLNYINLPLALRSINGAGIVKKVTEPLTISELIASNATEVAHAALKQQSPYLLMLNHPFWRYYNIVPQNLIDCPDIRYFEVTNNGSQFAPHPLAPNYTVEQFWDAVNAFRRIQGQPLLYGIGSEDTHVYDDKHVGDAWMMVRATALTPEKLLAAIHQGDCYASNGVELKDVDFSATDNTLRVAVKHEPGVNYRIHFITTKQGFDRTVKHIASPAETIGKGIRPARSIPVYSDDIGRIVKTVAGTEASYRLEADDLYVRARVESDVPGKFGSHFRPKVKTAWTQPYVAIKEAKEPELPSSILTTHVAARLVELTATISITNASVTDVQRYLFRLTTPSGDLPYQRSRLVMPFPGDTLKPHRNQLDNYLEMTLSVSAHKKVEREVRFLVLLLPVDYLKVPGFPIPERDKQSTQKYLLPSDLIESDAAEIKKVKDLLFGFSSSELIKAKAAYEYPSRVLTYRPQKAVGALNALKAGIGDCTEYACLFSALCRAGGVPARRVAVFNLGSQNEIADSEPNHDTAEVFLSTHGWVPVDPNGGGGRYDRPIGFARAGNTQIVLTRENAWVWSTFLPPDAVETNSVKPTIKSSVRWHAKVVQEGDSSELLRQFSNSRQRTAPSFCVP